MLPVSYQLPAAIVLLVGGTVACFFGYRLFRIVLAIFGFILGALAASSLFGASDTGPMLIAAIVGGLLGAAVLMAAYFVGVAMVGAGLGAAGAPPPKCPPHCASIAANALRCASLAPSCAMSLSSS